MTVLVHRYYVASTTILEWHVQNPGSDSIKNPAKNPSKHHDCNITMELSQVQEIQQQCTSLHQVLTVSKGDRNRTKGKGDDDATDATSDEVNERTHVVSEKSQQPITVV